MKRLADIGDKAELEGVRLLLESKGIPVFVGNEAGARNMGFLTPGRQQTLWVVFDEQLDDALALMADPEHVVDEPVDIEAYQSQSDHMEAHTRNQVFRMVMLGGLAVVVLVGLLLYVITRLEG